MGKRVLPAWQQEHLAELQRENVGRKHADAAKAKVSSANKGRRHSAETRAKVGAASASRRHTEETKAKIAASRRGKVVSDETRERMRQAALARMEKGKWKDTAPELAVRKFLDDIGMPYEAHVNEGGFNWDIRLGDGTLIEVNGCYWHMCEQCGHSAPDKRAKRRAERDKDRLEYAGDRLIVIWEHDVKAGRVRAILEERWV